MTPLLPSEIRARRRPWPIVHVYLVELLLGLVTMTPIHAWVARVWGAHPDGDAVLWAPGGGALLTFLGQQDAATGIVSRVWLVLVVVSAVALLIPQGALLASLAFGQERGPESEAALAPRAPRWQSALRVGVSTFTPLGGVLVLGWIMAPVILAGGAFLGTAIDHALAHRLGATNAFYVRMFVIALAGLLAAVVGVVLDLARAAIAREAGLRVAGHDLVRGWGTLKRGLRVALRAARRTSLVRATAAWGVRAALGVVSVAGGYAAASLLGGKGGGALALLWLVHQLVILLLVALRASWLARALAIVAPVQDAP
ncbi:MAG: hypothetical protein JWP97_664 [Labilithrix sp.]|nr:hypothetical protein [Labilithrix sp.]